MKKIVILNSELGCQMQIYLALCDLYKVEIAENLESVLYLLRRDKPEILLMDFNSEQFKTNGNSGLRFLKKVKKKYNNVKVLTILDDNHKSLETEIQQNGADVILYKPIKNRNLISYVKKLSISQ